MAQAMQKAKDLAYIKARAVRTTNRKWSKDNLNVGQYILAESPDST